MEIFLPLSNNMRDFNIPQAYSFFTAECQQFSEHYGCKSMVSPQCCMDLILKRYFPYNTQFAFNLMFHQFVLL